MKFEVTMETKFPKWRIAIEDSPNPYLSVVVKNTKEKSNGFKYFSVEEGCSKLKGIIVSIKKNTPLKIKKYLKNNGIVYFEECSLKIDDILKDQLTELINLVREDEHFETLCETQTVKRKDLDLLCNQFNLTSTDNQEAVLEISAMIDNICEYIKELIK